MAEGDCQAEEYDVFVLGTMEVAAISDPREVCSVLTTARSKSGSHRTQVLMENGKGGEQLRAPKAKTAPDKSESETEG